MKQVISDILVVDDNESNRILMVEILEKAGYSVREAENGELALLSIKTKKPALVILDVMLPGIDGYEVCRKIKSNKNTREIPVVFISALETDQSKISGFMAGGVDYISKPFSSNEVLARVRAQINLYRLQSKLKRKNEKLEREILKRKNAEEELQTSLNNYKIVLETIQNERKLLRTLIDNLPDAIYIKDQKARKLVANAADMNIMNCSSESEIIGKTDLEIFNDENGRQGYAEDISVIKTGKAIHNKENFYYDTNGELHWRIISKIPLADNQGNIHGLIGFGHDITEKRKTEDRIKTLSKAIEQGPSSIVITNAQGIIEFVNDRFTDSTQYTMEDVIGKKPRIFNPGHLSPLEYDTLWDSLESGNVWKGELVNRRKDNTEFWEEVTISSINDDKGQVTNYILILDDISPKKKIMDELVNAKIKAEESDRLKSAFLANMSHEIRTPLNCILGFSELLSDPLIDATERDDFNRLIELSGKNLLTIINDVMDISKIEAGQVQVHKSLFTAQQLIHDVHNEFKHLANDKGIHLNVDRNIKKSNLYLESDESKLKQVLINFVGNAIKFTEKGYIDIGFKAHENVIEFYVKDTGIGIPLEFHDHVFDRFRQLEGSATRKYGGNGLGLAISKSLIEMLGGKIGMESVEGIGSTFYFTIPC